jgi:hypothetical protein
MTDPPAGPSWFLLAISDVDETNGGVGLYFVRGKFIEQSMTVDMATDRLGQVQG